MRDTKRLRNGFVWIVLVVAVVALWFTLVGGEGGPTQRSIGNVVAVTMRQKNVVGRNS